MGSKKEIRWTEIAVSPQHERWQLLSKILNEAGVANCYEPSATAPERFAESLSQATQNMGALRIGSPFGQLVTRHFPYEPVLSMSLGAADTLLPIQGKWWTRSALYQAFHHLLREFGDLLNMKGTALVVGAGAAARIAIASLIKIGFKQIKLTNQEPTEAQALMREMSRSYFGVSFEFVPLSHLIMLPGTNSIMVNTTPSGVDNELIKELLYFNFLEPGGEVWDLSLSPIETALVKEAEEIGTRVVRGSEVASWVDVVWAKWVFGYEMDRNSYLKSLTEMLNKNLPPEAT
ncbi:MAG: hypothetical protein IT288_10495 [Bdellovibrionales bacterium]|nr:hypothetical protein [Bdellovibrionales bacterium]